MNNNTKPDGNEPGQSKESVRKRYLQERKIVRARRVKNELETFFALRMGGIFAVALALFLLGQPLYAGLANGFDTPYEAYGLDLGRRNRVGKGITSHRSVPADELSLKSVLVWSAFALLGAGLIRVTNVLAKEVRADAEKRRLEDDANS